MTKTPSFEVIAGTYEEFLLGYYYNSKEKQFIQSFAAHDHSSSIRCVTSSGHYLASGGADDRINVYDLKTRTQTQTLTHHEATITCLQFTENCSHLISASALGDLAIVRIGSWQVEKKWEKAHKGTNILDIAIHSSGKLALTLGADCTLCTWNLVKGRQAYVINLRTKCKDAKSLEKIVWGPDNTQFILYGGKYTEIWSIETGGVIKQIEHDVKVTACQWIKNNLLIGHESGDLTYLELETDFKKVFKAHKSRVKSLQMFKKWTVSVSSDGEIKIWDKRCNELAKIETGCRLTCLCLVSPIKVKLEKEEEMSVIDESEHEEICTKAQVIEITEDSTEGINYKKRNSKDPDKKSKRNKLK